MPNEDYLVRMKSLQEQKEAIEEKLDWIDFQRSMIRNDYKFKSQWLEQQRQNALDELRVIISEQKKGRAE